MDLLVTIAYIAAFIATAALLVIHWPSGLVAFALLWVLVGLLK